MSANAVDELVKQDVRIAHLEAEVAALRRELTQIAMHRTDCKLTTIDESEFADVIAVCQEMFHGQPEFEFMCDPEDPEHPFFVFTVRSHGTPKELIERQLQWHDRVNQLKPEFACSIRLSIIPE